MTSYLRHSDYLFVDSFPTLAALHVGLTTISPLRGSLMEDAERTTQTAAALRVNLATCKCGRAARSLWKRHSLKTHGGVAAGL